MTVPTIVLKLVFTISAVVFSLLLGAMLGATVFGKQSGHGIGGIENIFAGACCGAFGGAGRGVGADLHFKTEQIRPQNWHFCVRRRCSVDLSLHSDLRSLQHVVNERTVRR